MQNAHMDALTTKHASLDARISEENLRPFPDTTALARLKKEKLSRVEVTRTSLAVDAVREGRSRPEEYSDDDGAIAC